MYPSMWVRICAAFIHQSKTWPLEVRETTAQVLKYEITRPLFYPGSPKTFSAPTVLRTARRLGVPPRLQQRQRRCLGTAEYSLLRLSHGQNALLLELPFTKLCLCIYVFIFYMNIHTIHMYVYIYIYNVCARYACCAPTPHGIPPQWCGGGCILNEELQWSYKIVIKEL